MSDGNPQGAELAPLCTLPLLEEQLTRGPACEQGNVLRLWADRHGAKETTADRCPLHLTTLTTNRFSKQRSAVVSFAPWRSEEHTSELQSLAYLVCRLLLEKKKHAPVRKR